MNFENRDDGDAKRKKERAHAEARSRGGKCGNNSKRVIRGFPFPGLLGITTKSTKETRKRRGCSSETADGSGFQCGKNGTIL